MAVVLPMTATAHHPSLRPRRPSATSWTPISSANPLSRRPDSIQLQAQHHQSMHASSRTTISNRARSASSRSRSPSSHSSRSSISPRIPPNALNHLGLSTVVGGSGEALGLSLNGRRSGSISGGPPSASVHTLGVHRTRRPRRRADEVERLYKCTWNGCEKSYGTLSHLNDHVRLQRHGNKREPHEFKEARRIWRQERKSRRLREHAMHAASSSSSMLAPASTSISTPATAGRNFSGISSNSTIYSRNHTRAGSYVDDRSSPEYGDRERSRTPLTPVGLKFGLGIAAPGYHSYTRGSDAARALNTSSTLPRLTPSMPEARIDYDSRHIRERDDDHPSHAPHTSNTHGPSPNGSPSPRLDASKPNVRLPSIAELRLDLSLDEYDRLEQAKSALGSLGSSSTPVTRPPSEAGPVDYHSSRMNRHRRRDSWGSPSASSGASQSNTSKYRPYPQPLAPPPYSHYNGNDNTNTTQSPDFTNQYRFRISSTSTSPAAERPPSRSVQAQQQNPYSQSQSRPVSSSRPSTATTTTTSTQSYPHSGSAYPPSSFPFIPAAPPRTTPETSEGEPRRKRRKYEEIERRYLCGYNGCTKAYGTLNHLNDHVSLQGHGAKRRSSQF